MPLRQDMILDNDITIYASLSDKFGHRGTLGDYLRLCLANKEKVKALQATQEPEERKRLKSQLPAATISGYFEPTRATANLKQHSGLICIDIDHVENIDATMEILSEMDIVAYVSRSVSGEGIYAIIPLAYPERHKQQFEALRRYFAGVGIELDKQCSDVTRLRICSYDADARIRLDAVPFRGVYEEPRPVYKRQYYAPAYDTTMCYIEILCSQIEADHYDLTDNYNEWIKIGFSLAELGESGRDYFHRISAQCSSKYNPDKCNKQFDNCLKTASRCGIGHFFKLCQEKGYSYK